MHPFRCTKDTKIIGTACKNSSFDLFYDHILRLGEGSEKIIPTFFIQFSFLFGNFKNNHWSLSEEKMAQLKRESNIIQGGNSSVA